MDNGAHLYFNASDRSYFSLLKKDIHALAQGLQFPVKRLAELDIVVAEIVSNLGKYGRDGQLLAKAIEDDGRVGVELISIDAGPGIGDVNQVMGDGISTGNTLGHGLGSIKRLSDDFQIYSQRGWGTLLLARVYANPRDPKRPKPMAQVHGLVLPKPGETACGDGYHVKRSKESLRILIGDGLGHGPEAQAAVQQAIRVFRTAPEENPCELLRAVHDGVKRTRGLVATVVGFNFREKVWRICGVGNIATRIMGGIDSRNYITYNGIVGLNMPSTINEQVVPYQRGQVLVVCSDGIRSKWDTLRLPGILRYDLSLLAAALHKDFTRNTDDASVVAVRINN